MFLNSFQTKPVFNPYPKEDKSKNPINRKQNPNSMKRLQNALCITMLLFISFTVKAQVPVLNSYPQAAATIFLDFDGQTVSSPYWTTTPFFATPANLTNDQIISVFNRVSDDFRPFNINITTDSTVFLAATPGRRQRVIITAYSSWYGNAGGVAYNPSFRWSADVPAFVFSNLLATSGNPETNSKRVAEAVSHESGHTLGLNHQRVFNTSCGLVTEYNPGTGSGEISWAPIMGNSYSRNITTWFNGSYSCNTSQDELQIISGTQNGFSYRTDDIGGSINQAANIIVSGSSFGTNAIINTTNDIDIFRITLNNNSRLNMNIQPSNGAGGYNIDMKAELLSSNGTLIDTYDPSASVSAQIDTALTQGTYFVRVSNTSNAFVSNYGMLGNYTVSGTVISGTPLPVYSLNLNGKAINEKHELEWNIIADEPIEKIQVEVSTDGKNFSELQTIGGDMRKFVYQPSEKTTFFYRLHVITASQLKYYSNIVSIRQVNSNRKYNLLTNIISQNSVVVNSNGNYQWRLVDMNGRQLSSGRFNTGSNRIEPGFMSNGMYLLQVIDGSEITTEKIIKK
jgi:hypothetical protein